MPHSIHSFGFIQPTGVLPKGNIKPTKQEGEPFDILEGWSNKVDCATDDFDVVEGWSEGVDCKD